jgi:hypothetical protein
MAVAEVTHQMVDEAIGEYCKRFGEQSLNEMLGVGQKWGGYESQTQAIFKASDDKIQAKLSMDLELPQGRQDGTDCQRMANLMMQQIQDEEKERLKGERLQKEQQRTEYGIGWKVEHIPRTDEPASKLAMCEVPQGMVSLVIDDETNSVRLGATTEPTAALNLDYLSTSLQVRRTEGHEPTFSLDAVDPEDNNSMQAKVFSPEWLAGTSVGEVLFQADYHLKELSMGEYEQPVVGMKSCFDYSEIGNSLGWSAREWFLVRKAEVKISDSNMLVPLVKMGVEAREQAMSGNSLEDKPVTRADHPMVKYAESFTRNFDLIAERKSVVYHLRELAKASVMAKFLLDSNVDLEEDWFNVAMNKDNFCSLEVPQLWNERIHSEMHGDTCNRRLHGVYGGVQFGLDKFSLSTSVARQASVQAGLSQHRLAFGLSKRAGLAPASYIQSMASGAHFAPPSAALSAAAVKPARIGAPSAALSAASITGAPRLATSIGVTPLAAKLPPPSATLSATVAPRLATSIGITKLTPLSAKFAPPSASLSATVAPRLATSVGAGVGMARAPSLSAKFAPPSATLSSTVAPRLATSIGAGIGMARAPALSAKFAPPSASLSSTVAPRLATSIGAGVGMARAPALSAKFAPAAASLSSTVAPRLATSIGAGVGMARAPQLQGVDLRLDQFDLSEATHMSAEEQAEGWASAVKPLEECVAMGDAFFACLDGSKQLLNDDDRGLLKNVFHPVLSDRRQEGDVFMPPSARHAYVHKLRALVKEEESVRAKRKEVFLGRDFQMSAPGSVFPHSWTPSVELADAMKSAQIDMKPCSEKQEQVATLLECVAPVFDNTTEDGARFRIYNNGGLEVRTVQMFDGEETIGAVFSEVVA